MKRKTLIVLLALEALALLALTVLKGVLPGVFSSVLAFPFEQIGEGLWALSRLGGVWNGLALALLAAIAAGPLFFALEHIRERQRLGENIALIVLTALLVFVLANIHAPGKLFHQLLQDGAEHALPVERGILGVAVWSMAVCWACLRLVRLFRAGSTQQLYRYLRAMVCCLCALFVGALVLSPAAELVEALGAAQCGADRLFAVLRFVAGAIPYGYDLAVCFYALALLGRLQTGVTAQAADWAERLSGCSCRALTVMVTACAALNLAQLLFARGLSDVSVSVEIPLTSLAFVLLALLFARLVAENARLTDENEAFI